MVTVIDDLSTGRHANVAHLEADGRFTLVIDTVLNDSLAEVLAHWLVALYDRVLRTKYDMDGERGMGEEEAYYLKDSEITERLARAGFREITKRRFLTQWGLNHLLVGWKRA
jgi:hypothetical protein